MKTLIRNKGSNIKIFLFILGISTWTFPATVNAYDKIIVLNTANDCPNATQSFDGIADRIVKEAFDRLKIKIKRIRLPSERAISNANQGIDDGNYSRIRGLEKTYLNLLMVPVAITNFEFVAFSQNKTISVKSWDSLQAYNVAIIRGWKILETNISKYKSRILVKDEQQLFKMLDNGRVDIIVYDKAQGQYLLLENHWPLKRCIYICTCVMLRWFRKLPRF
jgi:polar amino acid transport system substrate-binding protein